MYSLHVQFKPVRRLREWMKKKWFLPYRRRRDRIPLVAWAESSLEMPCRAEDLGGKSRLSLRLHHARGSHVVQLVYEKKLFAKIAALGEYLSRQGVHVPRILHSDSQRAFLLLEDLGSVSAGSAIAGGVPPREVLPRIIRELARLHSFGPRELDGAHTFVKPFDPDRWQYFVLKRLSWLRAFSPRISRRQLEEVEQDLKQYRAGIEPERGIPRLCHMDCHLGNFILKDSAVYILDWEVAALCPPALELAKWFAYTPTRLLWRSREEITAGYLAEVDLPPEEKELFHPRLEFFEVGYLLWRLPLFLYNGPKIQDFSILDEVLREVSTFESLEPYPALRGIMEEVSDIVGKCRLSEIVPKKK
jgi:Ser/Thr protein kinase RdoA (MazF antagonist)